ncbi:calcium-binding protein [Pseudaestuariivita atlantica]|uniref:Calcium-binding protein n=1 Tax=Pseudaestuariivita atlantica TaxID=1317121 RepID=A0A0L1JLH6_9RHOB|nr:hypothetical protein [Pseudaestuariivita atlantica]KNG92604.1 hypothetical protein ATO11_16400 [Pseudaestuariivita atlantica]
MSFLILSLLGLSVLGAAFWGAGGDGDGDTDTDRPDGPFDFGMMQDDGMDGGGMGGGGSMGGGDGDPDLGATLTEESDGSITIELGEDETGSVTALQTVSVFNGGETVTTTYATSLLLVPEGVDLEAALDGNDMALDFLPAILADLGVETLDTYPQGSVTQELTDAGFVVTQDVSVDLPAFTSDDGPLPLLRVEGEDNGDGFIPTGAEPVDSLDRPEITDPDVVFDLGTSQSGEVLQGASGDDTLSSGFSETTINGGAGDDVLTIEAQLMGTTTGSAVANGDAGDDILTGTSEQDFARVVLNGGDGDDALSGSAFVGSLEANGGAGNDNILLANSLARGEGGDGNDTLTATAEAQVNGGAGDDVLQSRLTRDFTTGTNSGGILTGGEGADSFVILARSGSGTSTDPTLLDANAGVITDFTPGEDMLTINVQDFSFIDNITFSDDGTDTTVSYFLTLGPETITQSFTVQGVTGLTLADITVIQ